MNHRWCVVLVLFLLLTEGCKEEVFPKPAAMLRLEYPAFQMEMFETDQYSFAYNKSAIIKENRNSLEIKYPFMKGSIFINYRKVGTNLGKLLADAQKFSNEHAMKADGISEQPFVNEPHKVYGTFFEVTGDAASQAQFYATDSTEHFLTGSLYFYVRPNFDSIYPAATYLQNDARRIMETLQWK